MIVMTDMTDTPNSRKGLRVAISRPRRRDPLVD